MLCKLLIWFTLLHIYQTLQLAQKQSFVLSNDRDIFSFTHSLTNDSNQLACLAFDRAFKDCVSVFSVYSKLKASNETTTKTARFFLLSLLFNVSVHKLWCAFVLTNCDAKWLGVATYKEWKISSQTSSMYSKHYSVTYSGTVSYAQLLVLWRKTNQNHLNCDQSVNQFHTTSKFIKTTTTRI